LTNITNSHRCRAWSRRHKQWRDNYSGRRTDYSEIRGGNVWWDL